MIQTIKPILLKRRLLRPAALSSPAFISIIDYATTKPQKQIQAQFKLGEFHAQTEAAELLREKETLHVVRGFV